MVTGSGAVTRWIESMTALARGPIARGAIVSVMIRLAGLAISFVQAVLTARVLGIGGYGLIAVAMSVAQIAATFCLFGFGTLAVREIPRRSGGNQSQDWAGFTVFALGCVVMFSIGGALLVASFGQFGASLIGPYSRELTLAALIVPPLALLQLFRGISQGRGHVINAQLPGEILRPALVTAAMVIFVLLGMRASSHIYLLIALMAISLSAMAGGLFALRGIPKRGPIIPEPHIRKQWLADTVPFFGLAIVAILLGEINTLMLAWLATPEQVGLFQPAARIAPLMTIPGQAAAIRFAPRIAELSREGNTAEIVKLTRLFTLITTLLTACSALGLAILAPFLMRLFGKEFAGAVDLLWIIAAAQIFNAACGPVGFLLTMSGSTGSALAGQLVGLAANIAVSLLCIPIYGATGAAIGFAAGIALWNLSSLIAVRKRLGFNASIIGKS